MKPARSKLSRLHIEIMANFIEVALFYLLLYIFIFFHKYLEDMFVTRTL